MEKLTGQTPLREIEIFGIPALFTDQDIPPDEQSPDMFYYELVSADGSAALLGTVLTLIPVEIPESGERDVYDSDLMLDTAGELLEKVKQAAAAGEELERKFGREPGTDYIWAAEKFLRELYAERAHFISTGYKSLDACTGGLLPGSVYVLAGRTGEGKTALALNMALFFTTEGQSIISIGMRALPVKEETSLTRVFC